MRRFAHKTPLLSLTVLTYLLAIALAASLIGPLQQPTRKTFGAKARTTFSGSWTDLIGSWESDFTGSSQPAIVTFTTHNHVIIDTDCATHRGRFLSIVPGHLAIVNMHTAKRHCSSGTNRIEPVVTVLEAATEYGVVRGQFLQIFGEAGQATFLFRRAPMPPRDEITQ